MYELQPQERTRIQGEELIDVSLLLRVENERIFISTNRNRIKDGFLVNAEDRAHVLLPEGEQLFALNPGNNVARVYVTPAGAATEPVDQLDVEFQPRAETQLVGNVDIADDPARELGHVHVEDTSGTVIDPATEQTLSSDLKRRASLLDKAGNPIDGSNRLPVDAVVSATISGVTIQDWQAGTLAVEQQTPVQIGGQPLDVSAATVPVQVTDEPLDVSKTTVPVSVQDEPLDVSAATVPVNVQNFQGTTLTVSGDAFGNWPTVYTEELANVSTTGETFANQGVPDGVSVLVGTSYDNSMRVLVGPAGGPYPHELKPGGTVSMQVTNTNAIGVKAMDGSDNAYVLMEDN